MSGALEKIRENFSEDEIILADGFEDALIGVGWSFDKKPSAIYDRTRCIRILMKNDGMTEEDAEEYFSYNVEGAYVGERSPIFMLK